MENVKTTKTHVSAGYAGAKMHSDNIFFEKSVSLTVAVIELARNLRSDPALWSVLDQVIRSSGSIGANVSEAHGGRTKKDFANYFAIALKSANETIYWLGVLRRAAANKSRAIEQLVTDTEVLQKILKKSLHTMRAS